VDNDDEETDLDIPTKAQPDIQGESAEYRSATTPVASKSETVMLTPTSPRAVSTLAAALKAVTSPVTVKAATSVSTKVAESAAAATPVAAEDITTPVRGRSVVLKLDRGTKAPTDSTENTEFEASPACDEAWLEVNPAEFETVKKGGDEYDDNPELGEVTTVKPTMVVKSNVNKRTVTKTDTTEPAPGTAAQRVEHPPHEENNVGDEKLKAEVVDENNNTEDKDLGGSARHIKPSPREYAAQFAAEAPTKEERTDGDSQNSEEGPDPDKAKQRPAQHPRDDLPPALRASTAASMFSMNKPKARMQNRNKEGQVETANATEDDAGEVDTEEIAEKKAAEPDKPASQTPIEDEGN
jgi:hypothetical protein